MSVYTEQVPENLENMDLQEMRNEGSIYWDFPTDIIHEDKSLREIGEAALEAKYDPSTEPAKLKYADSVDETHESLREAALDSDEDIEPIGKPKHTGKIGAAAGAIGGYLIAGPIGAPIGGSVGYVLTKDEFSELDDY